jgi:type I restriction enzyme S subunit
MADGWASSNLGKLSSEITVGFVGPMVAEYRPTGIPFLRSQNVEPFRINDNELRFIGSEFHARIKKSRLRSGDVVIVRTGTPGISAVIPDWLDNANCADLVIVRPSGELDPHFLAYFLNSVALHHIDSRLVGAVQQHFNVSSARELPVAHPSLAEQRRIVGVLRSIDRKIELNRLMNQTLESMSRAIFRSWFVDFDPVAAKAAGRQPFGMSADIAALFPGGFVNSDLGPIPIGWHHAPLAELAHIIMGASPPGESYNYSGAGVSLINGPVEFGERFPVRTKWTTAPTRRSQDGDLIICVRGSTTGRMVKSNGEYCLGRGVCAIRAKRGGQSFIDAAVELNLDRLLSLTAGSVFPNLSGTDIEAFEVLAPSEPVVLAYSSLADRLNARIQANVEQTHTLAALRDTLLPKLMSGELRIRDVEKQVEAHV